MTLPPLLLHVALSADDAETLSNWASQAADAITKLRAENAQYDATLTVAIEREDALRAERDKLSARLRLIEGGVRPPTDDELVRELGAQIVDLRAERDNAIAECVMHIGNAKALRDRLNWFEEAGGVAMATRIYQVIGERDALKAQLAKTQNAESMQRMDCRNLTEKVIPNLREQRDALAAENLTLRNAAVNASEQHDALAALLRELDETWIRSTCPQSIRDRIDAALAGKDAP